MSLGLLWPAALAGLAALLLPLLAHLVRHREARRISFAAMRWLPPGRSARRRPRIEEVGLLVLRLLLVAVAVLWLALPQLRGSSEKEASWILAWPGVDPTAARDAGASADHAVWLADGFPPLSQQPPSASGPASLLRELDARLPAGHRLTVLLPDPVSGLDAAALRTSRKIEFQPAPSSAATPVVSEQPDPYRVLLAIGEGTEAALPYLRAALAAWRDHDQHAIELVEASSGDALPDRVDAVVRVGQGAQLPAAWSSLPQVIVAADEEAHASALESGTTHRLGWPSAGRVPALALDPGFPEWLATRLRPSKLPAKTSAAAFIAAAGVSPQPQDGRRMALERDLTHWFALALALLFAFERLVATGRRLRGGA